MYLNKAQIIGNLTRDPEMKALPSGIKVTNFSVATNRTWKDRDGKKQESTDFHNVVVFGKQAELIAQYMKKGSQILVEGRMQTRSWDADGGKKYRTEIIAETFQFGQKPASAKPTQAKSKSEREDEGEDTDVDEEWTPDDINPEDIPF